MMDDVDYDDYEDDVFIYIPSVTILHFLLENPSEPHASLWDSFPFLTRFISIVITF